MMTSASRRAATIAGVAVAAQVLSGCMTIPPLVLNGRQGEVAPAGPKAASLVANLKCELWDAANSTQPLPFYYDQLPLKARTQDPALDREFTLKNLFQEIEYVGEATFTLDVTGTGAVTPSNTFSQYYRPGAGVIPATGATLAVGGQVSDAAHRFITFDSSVDFSRLVDSPPNARFRADAVRKAAMAKAGAGTAEAEATTVEMASDYISPTPLRLAATPQGACDQGGELSGALGLKETLATGLIAAAMNDVALFPTQTAPTGSEAEAAPGDSAPVAALAAPPTAKNGAGIQLSPTYTYGQISAQVDFTIIKSVNGGPSWVLKDYKGPAGGNSGLLSYQRQVKDTLAITFVPVCIRNMYYPLNRSAPYTYSPGLVARHARVGQRSAPVRHLRGRRQPRRRPDQGQVQQPADDPAERADSAISQGRRPVLGA